MKKTSRKRATAKKSPRKTARRKSIPRKRTRSQRAIGVRMRAGSGRQAGDLQGISAVERADSESVDELLAEGNAFEADAVAGVEDAENADGREVRTHEVPEDDVPGEYLDKD